MSMTHKDVKSETSTSPKAVVKPVVKNKEDSDSDLDIEVISDDEDIDIMNLKEDDEEEEEDVKPLILCNKWMKIVRCSRCVDQKLITGSCDRCYEGVVEMARGETTTQPVIQTRISHDEPQWRFLDLPPYQVELGAEELIITDKADMLQCKHCLRQFSLVQENDWAVHVSSHIPYLRWKCPVVENDIPCNKKTFFRSHMRMHLRNKHEDKLKIGEVNHEKSFKIRGRTMQSGPRWREKDGHKWRGGGSISCTSCDYKTSNMLDFARHEREKGANHCRHRKHIGNIEGLYIRATDVERISIDERQKLFDDYGVKTVTYPPI